MHLTVRYPEGNQKVYHHFSGLKYRGLNSVEGIIICTFDGEVDTWQFDPENRHGAETNLQQYYIDLYGRPPEKIAFFYPK